MKLAAALTERAELQTRLQQLAVRLNNNALVQEGEKPAEAPVELLEELEAGYARLEELIARINRTNSEARVGSDTLSDLLARRDCFKGKLGVLRAFAAQASATASRRTVGEIRIMSTVNVRELQKQIDGLSRRLRELDDLIQEQNWTVELL